MISITDHAGWWGLLGLLVPFIIHLLSKKEKTVIPFGSIRFLRPVESDSAKSIELTQYALLFLRLLLVALIAFLITQPFVSQEKSSKTYWVEESVFSDPSYEGIISKIPEETDLTVFSYEDADPEETTLYPSAWALINHLNAFNDSAIVYTHSFQNDFIGSPVMLGSHVDWNVVPSKNEIIQDKLYKEQETITWSAESDGYGISVNAERTDGRTSEEESTAVLQLVDNSNGQQGRKLKSVIDLIEEDLPYQIEWQESEEESADWKIIVGDESIQDNSNVIVWMPSADQLQVERVGENVLSIEGDITRESLLETNLPVMLTAMLNKEKIGFSELDNRVFIPQQASLATIESNQGEKEILPVKKPIESYLLFLIVPLFITERFVNYKSSEL